MSLAFNFLAMLCAIAFSIGDGNTNVDTLEEIKTSANPGSNVEDVSGRLPAHPNSDGKRRLSLYTNQKTPWKPRTRNLRSTKKKVDSHMLYDAYSKWLERNNVVRIKDVSAILSEVGIKDPSQVYVSEIPIGYALLDDIANGNEIKEKYASNEDELKDAFKEYDTDGSGTLSCAEVDRLFKSLGIDMELDAVKEIITSVDGDATGDVSFAEFIKLWNVNFV